MGEPRLCIVPLTSLPVLTATRVQEAGHVGAAAFGSDPLFQWLRPHKTPDHFERLCTFFGGRVRASTQDKGIGGVLALWERKEGSETREEVVGWAIWEGVGVELGIRDGADSKDTQSAEQQTIEMDDDDPANDKERLAALQRVWKVGDEAINRVLADGKPVTIDFRTLDAQPPPEPAAIVPHMMLNLIAVLPKCQGHGIGGALLDWGTRRGDELGVPIVMGASPEGARLYRRKGFDNLGIRLIYAGEEDEREYENLNDDLLVRWPPQSKRI